MSTTICQECGGTVIEYDAAAGNGFCVACGTVVEENTIVSEVTFGEASSGAAIVQGSFVGQGSTHARMGGPYGNRNSSESREQTIEKASRNIQNVAHRMRLSEVVQTAATRMYTLALEHKFTKGRKNMNVVAVCLYIACRQKETRNYMLIDFSDLLQVNVFELGHTYLQLVQTLNLRLPLIDPSHYISRFASLLEFGSETPKVAADAVRLVSRFSRDWMSHGRRPAGICGACLLLAARMNNFRRSVQEVVQVVKIAETTLKKRLEEFRKTPSGGLTLADFRTVWLEEEMDPPAYTKGKEKEAKEKEKHSKRLMGEDVENGIEIGTEEEMQRNGKRKKKKGKKRKRTFVGESDHESDANNISINIVTEDATPLDLPNSSLHRLPIDPQLLNEGILAGTDVPLFLPDATSKMLRSEGPNDSSEHLIVSASLDTSTTIEQGVDPNLINTDHSPGISNDKVDDKSPENEDLQDEVLANEMAEFLHNTQGARLADAIDEADKRRRENRLQRHAKHPRVIDHIGDNVFGDGTAVGNNKLNGDCGEGEEIDELEGLDDMELDQFILNEEEVKIKERVWVEMNRDYLEAIAIKEAYREGMVDINASKSRKRRKANNKPRDISTPSGSTTIESVHSMIRKSAKYSKRINYEAIKKLFDGDVSVGGTGSGASKGMDIGSAGFEANGLAPPGEVNLDEKEEYMYTMDEFDGNGNGEIVGMVIEEGGGVGIGVEQVRTGSATPSTKPGDQTPSSRKDGDGVAQGEDEEDDIDADGEEVEMSDKGEEDHDSGDYWDEGYEQEV